ncbi:EamA family transporter [Streptomyces sp. HNM0645]|uniref:EamA family transporter n=1 Tax=Streptomyces sp. HNM0645 TaxID=2782343 RepID=UPI0024B6785E|nr:EamA family transporter [Streptomyces sp. HNM0645]MDI9887157.1 EamA family transporter [Streptomyces sp. HNM0645]
MPELFALSAALMFGLVHFFSGLLARRADSYAVAAFGQVGGIVLMLAVAVLMPVAGVEAPVLTASHITSGALGWGVLSGVGTGIGVACLYRGLAAGRMSVVAPLSSAAGVTLPVLVGVVVLGDRPSPLAWLGVAAAVPALWLVSRNDGPGAGGTASGARFGLLAGIGFAVQFLAISRIDPAAGLWPILAARAAATLTIALMARAARATLHLPRRLVLPALAVGSMGAVALVLYQAATLHQLLALATVLASLYPAVPVVLAVVFLHERPTTVQIAGLLCTGVAVVLIALG